MMIERILKIIMSGGLAILTALIAYANIRDPGANLKFVEQVLSMDTVAPDSTMVDHALPIPLAWRNGLRVDRCGRGADRLPVRRGNYGALASGN